MAAECLKALALESARVVVDGTVGGGGHTEKILQRLPDPAARVIGLDRDPAAIARSRLRLDDDRCQLVVGSYVTLPEAMRSLGIASVDRIFVGLGVSSDQLVDASRGFGFQVGGPLDLRFDPAVGVPASEWLRQTPAAEVARVLRDYADQPRAEAVAAALTQRPLATTEELVERVRAVVGREGGKHPATQTMQALRIAVNDELEHVDRAMRNVFAAAIEPGGILAVLTFHSVEDRIVKRALTEAVDASGKPVWTLRPKKPILPRPAEVRANPRSRSAKLRVAIRG